MQLNYSYFKIVKITLKIVKCKVKLHFKTARQNSSHITRKSAKSEKLNVGDTRNIIIRRST